VTRAGDSPGVVDLGGWVALGGREPRESEHDGARLLGSNSEAERSLRESCPSKFGWGVPTTRRPVRGKSHAAGALNPYGARAWGDDSERHVNRKRGARRIAI
jgi:hypothetical protein